MLAIYDADGRLLAEEGRDDDLEIALPPLDTIPTDDALLLTVVEADDDDDRHRLAFRRVDHSAVGHELHRRRRQLARADRRGAGVAARASSPTSSRSRWSLAGIGGWFLARQSLSPVVAMADRARKIGVENLSERLPVANPRDELGRLAETFNELLGRLEASLIQQRQFMADASHELRTPVATARTAASVALQQPHRDEREYRETLAIIEQQTARLSRIVDDMFTLARADAGNYPVRTTPMYLDEVVDEVVRAARVLASTQEVSIEPTTVPSAAFTGDEDLIRRLIVQPARQRRPARARRQHRARRARATPARLCASRSAIRGPASRPRSSRTSSSGSTAATRARASRRRDGGAGLGLALARWIAERPRRRRHAGALVAGGHDVRHLAAVAAAELDRTSRSSPVHARAGTLGCRI